MGASGDDTGKKFTTVTVNLPDEPSFGYAYSNKAGCTALEVTKEVGGTLCEPNMTVADDGTVTGYIGTSHLSFLCDTTVDIAEH